MSDATRAVALTQAVHVTGTEGGAAVLALAKQFDDFLNDVAGTKPAVSSSAGKEPGKPAAGTKPAAGGMKPAKTEDDLAREVTKAQAAREAAEDAERDAEGGEGTAETDAPEYPANSEGVQAVIAKMLQANKRKEAITLLKKFHAASATGVKAKDAAKFIAGALKIVGVAQEGSDDDLTA